LQSDVVLFLLVDGQEAQDYTVRVPEGPRERRRVRWGHGGTAMHRESAGGWWGKRNQGCRDSRLHTDGWGMGGVWFKVMGEGNRTFKGGGLANDAAWGLCSPLPPDGQRSPEPTARSTWGSPKPAPCKRRGLRSVQSRGTPPSAPSPGRGV
jgi:hypothetical protein